jgi:hypothetical protein
MKYPEKPERTGFRQLPMAEPQEDPGGCWSERRHGSSTPLLSELYLCISSSEFFAISFIRSQ